MATISQFAHFTSLSNFIGIDALRQSREIAKLSDGYKYKVIEDRPWALERKAYYCRTIAEVKATASKNGCVYRRVKYLDRHGRVESIRMVFTCGKGAFMTDVARVIDLSKKFDYLKQSGKA